ncbi:MAG: hypothetical protein ACTSW1_04855 [Candidatus Hodarchaeales archaeon]
MSDKIGHENKIWLFTGISLILLGLGGLFGAVEALFHGTYQNIFEYFTSQIEVYEISFPVFNWLFLSTIVLLAAFYIFLPLSIPSDETEE